MSSGNKLEAKEGSLELRRRENMVTHLVRGRKVGREP